MGAVSSIGVPDDMKQLFKDEFRHGLAEIEDLARNDSQMGVPWDSFAVGRYNELTARRRWGSNETPRRVRALCGQRCRAGGWAATALFRNGADEGTPVASYAFAPGADCMHIVNRLIS
jgi:hypothetical protein